MVQLVLIVSAFKVRRVRRGPLPVPA